MITYEEKEISLTTKDGALSVVAQVASNGLAYHCTQIREDTTKTEYAWLADRWTVTHVASGYSLCAETQRFESEQQCQDFINKVDGLCEWKRALPRPNRAVKQHINRLAMNCRGNSITTVF